MSIRQRSSPADNVCGACTQNIQLATDVADHSTRHDQEVWVELPVAKSAGLKLFYQKANDFLVDSGQNIETLIFLRPCEIGNEEKSSYVLPAPAGMNYFFGQMAAIIQSLT